MNLLFFSFSLVAFYAMHSLLAANAVKARLRDTVPDRYYRIGYNLIAVSLFGLLLLYYYTVEKQLLWSPNPLLPYPGGLLVLTGLVWMARAMKGYNLGEFIGLEQLRSGNQPRHNILNVKGLNAKVRHPLYFGTLLFVWGFFFIFPNDAAFIFTAISTTYLVVGSKLEEKKLVEQFGDAYRKYQRDVPMLVPFHWKRK